MKRKINIKKIAWIVFALYLLFAFGIGFKEKKTTETYVEQLPGTIVTKIYSAYGTGRGTIWVPIFEVNLDNGESISAPVTDGYNEYDKALPGMHDPSVSSSRAPVLEYANTIHEGDRVIVTKISAEQYGKQITEYGIIVDMQNKMGE